MLLKFLKQFEVTLFERKSSGYSLNIQTPYEFNFFFFNTALIEMIMSDEELLLCFSEL